VFPLIRTCAVGALLALGLALPAGAAGDGEGPRALRAAALSSPIQVDGRLDEPAWAAAEVATGFRQLEPDEGAPATQRTEVRVVYGPSALYIGATLYDDPALVRRPLTRRDEMGDADVFIVSLDGYGTGRSAYYFAVTAAGVQYDAALEADVVDPSWDAVWDSAVRHTPEGWTVEMAIPYSMLRFNRAEEQTWWIQFQRTISRNGEQVFWEPLTQDALGVGFIAGRLTGLRGLTPRANVQVRPYTLSRLTREPEAGAGPAYLNDTGLDAGLDVKLGLGRNAFLDLTLNPDFGQVEADPAVLNLTAFETFFPERRPFFLEGASIFDYTFAPGDGPLFYTRRVGALGRIVGAGKLTGRTAGGVGYGVLAGATGDGFTQGEGGPVFTGDDFSPDLLYAAARVKREFGNRSFAGAAATYFDGTGGDFDFYQVRSLVGGADWDLRWRGGTLRWDGAATASHVRFGEPFGGAEPETGFALYTGLDRVRGPLTGGVGLRVYSDRFDPNDVGFFLQNDAVRARGNATLLLNRGRPFGRFRLARASVVGQQAWTYRQRTNLGAQVQSRMDLFFRGFDQLTLRANLVALGGYDVLESRGLGPVANVPGLGLGADYTTDTRRRLVAFPRATAGFFRDGSVAWNASVGSDWTASDRLALSGSIRYEERNGVRGWVANEAFRRTESGFALGRNPNRAPNAQGTFDPFSSDPFGLDAVFTGLVPFAQGEGTADYFAAVFGSRDQRSLDASVRATYALRPDLSFQLFSQLFAARFRHDDFRLLAGPDDLRPLGAVYPRRRDQASQSLIFNAVGRWEYRPGSTVYVVWAHNRAGAFGGYRLHDAADPAPSPFDRGTLRLAADTFDLLPTNVVLVKLNYLLLR